MRALVISGGGSKGAFAGGVAQYLLEASYTYDLFVGTSTGSLLIPHLALNKVDKIRKVYTSIEQSSIFSSCPFVIKKEKYGNRQIGINYFNVIKNIFIILVHPF